MLTRKLFLTQTAACVDVVQVAVTTQHRWQLELEVYTEMCSLCVRHSCTIVRDPTNADGAVHVVSPCAQIAS